jgi:hypothetical protein
MLRAVPTDETTHPQRMRCAYCGEPVDGRVCGVIVVRPARGVPAALTLRCACDGALFAVLLMADHRPGGRA